MIDKKYVVYTVITGGFDAVKQPVVIDDRFDYVLFTDNVVESQIGVWSVRPIDYKNTDSRVQSRYPKIYPTKVLSEYTASLYIDGNIQITSKYVYDRCVELVEKGVEWSGIKHQGRTGLYNEINAIIGLGWVHDYDVIDWYKFLKREAFPDTLGMLENNIIFRRHCNSVQKVSECWGSVCVQEQRVKRDQFSLMWAIWKTGKLNMALFLDADENAWNNSGHFLCSTHNPHKRILNKSLWEKLRDRYVRTYYASNDWEIYYTHWFDKLLQYPFPKLGMHIWTIYILIRYDLGFLAKQIWNKN
jgi:hypothetical protein